MKRAGFTLLELIFVIVILGVLAAVAIPKLTEVKESADEGLIKGFVGTLNRTVGASKWSQSLRDGADGSVLGSSYDISTADTGFPSSFSDNQTVILNNCADVNDTVGNGLIAALSNDSVFFIICRDGNAIQAPKFWYTESNLTATFDDTKLKL